MTWNLKDYGDPLEKSALNFIELNDLGGYKNFWNEFVGNINGNPARLEFQDGNIDNKRKLLAQWNYTILKNLYIINRLQTTRYNKHKIRHNNLNDVLHYDKDFILVTHLIYNNIEILDKINDLLNGKSGIGSFKTKYRDFINFRNLLSHNIKPLTKYDNSYLVPKNFEWFTNNAKDDLKIIWSDNHLFNNIEYQPINEYLTWGVEVIISDFKELLTSEFTYCKSLFNNEQKNKIVDIPQSNILKTKVAPFSGTTTK